MKKVRVRYAPSPTGLLHIGNARTALFNYLFARHNNGDFLIRIEDTDILRNVEDGEKSQLDNLSWLGIDWDESPDKPGNYGPYRQLERLDIYKKYADELLEKGLAYKDYRDDEKELYAIRFKVPKNQIFSFKDMIRGELKFESKDIEDWIIVKDNGIPTYNFAVVIDDHLMEITHVLRGEEHITNTPKQVMIYQAFNWEIPLFGHMTIIVNEDKKKLSKRDNSIVQFISEYKEMGYLPEAMLNFISLLGFSPAGEEEILSKDELIKIFDDKRLSKAPAMFDKVKLAYINSRYIKKMTNVDLANLCKPFLIKENIVIKSDEWLLSLVEVFKDRLNYGKQIVDLYKEFFHLEFRLTDEGLAFLKENNSLEVIKAFSNELKNNSFTIIDIEKAIKDAGINANVKGKQLFMPCRIATTGDMHGPSLPASLSLLGKEVVLKRLENTISLLEERK